MKFVRESLYSIEFIVMFIKLLKTVSTKQHLSNVYIGNFYFMFLFFDIRGVYT